MFDVKTTGGLDLTLDYDIQLGLGIDKAKGVFFVLNENQTDPEIELNAAVQLQDGTELAVDIFFLEDSASENAAGDPNVKTGLSGTLDVNLSGPGNELKLSEITSTPFDQLVDVKLNVEAIVDLQLRGGTTDPKLPALTADFFVDWGFTANFGDPDPFAGKLNDVHFANFGIDLGGYVKDVLGSVVEQIDDIMKPLDPLIDFLNADVPLISDVSVFLRRAKKHSTLSAVVVKFSRARKRYERQGILVTSEAISFAEQQCLADEDQRARRRERDASRRVEEDQTLVEEMAETILAGYPGCPPQEARRIAEHTAQRGSGRVGRSAAGRGLHPDAIALAVGAWIRHQHTPYDSLLMQGNDRLDARDRVREKQQRVLAEWSNAHSPEGAKQ